MHRTTRQETADILFESHEKQHGELPQHLATFELPAIVDTTGKNLLTEIEHFHRIAQEKLPVIVSMIKGANDSLEGNKDFTDAHEEWVKQLAIAYPQETFGRVTVSFHLFSSPLSLYSGIKNSESSSITAPRILATFSV